MKKILLVDDDRNACQILTVHLKDRGFEVASACSGKDGLAKIKSFSPNIVLLGDRLPGTSGLSVLKQIRGLNEEIFVIMSTASTDGEKTLQTMKAGAFEHINKPIIPEALDLLIHKIRGILALRRRVDLFVGEESIHFRIDNIVGKTRQMIEIFKTIAIASESNATVLIEGETGTGKELIARAIHCHASRETPFIGINCSAPVDKLVESELFGHEKGAFTGAVHRRSGKLEQAEDGTLFLDEVGDLSPALQAKLLRVMQEREFGRIGGKERIRSNARIIAATCRPLDEMVMHGKFREDLHNRLKVISIKVPPLRERPEDTPAIVHHLLNRINWTLHKNVKRISPMVLDLLMAYTWPGNIRELENVMTRAVALTRGEVLLEESFAPFADIRPAPASQNGFLSLRNLEQEHVKKVLHFTEGHKGEACRILGISRPALERKIRRYQNGTSGIQRNGSSSSSAPERV